MASLHKREGKRGTTYKVVWRLEDGKQRAKSFKDKDEAKRFRTDVEALEQRGRAPDTQKGSVSLEDWSQEFLDTLHLKPKSVASYESLLRSRILPAFGEWPLSGIKRLDVQKWVASMSEEVSPRRTRSAYALLNQMLSEAVKHERLMHNPAAGISLPKAGKQDIQPLTMEELKAVAAEAGRYEPLVLFLGIMGTRWSEAIGLTWDRVNDTAVTIDRALTETNGKFDEVATKTYEIRRLPVPGFLMDKLERGEGYVFQTTHGNPIRSAAWRKSVFRPACEAAGIKPVKVHTLRHTAASLLISQGANIKLVQKYLGHATASMTLDLYGHLYGNDLEELSNKMDRMLRDN